MQNKNLKNPSPQFFLLIFTIFALSLMFAQFAYAQSPAKPLLNSEMIQNKYGSYGIKVLKKSPTLRISDLYSTHDGAETMRTLAFVIFQDVTLSDKILGLVSVQLKEIS